MTISECPAISSLRNDLRSFSVDAFREAAMLDERAKEVPKGELEEYLSSGYGIFAGRKVEWATIRFTPLAARWVSAQRWHSKQKARTEDDGSYVLELVRFAKSGGETTRFETPASGPVGPRSSPSPRRPATTRSRGSGCHSPSIQAPGENQVPVWASPRIDVTASSSCHSSPTSSMSFSIARTWTHAMAAMATVAATAIA